MCAGGRRPPNSARIWTCAQATSCSMSAAGLAGPRGQLAAAYDCDVTGIDLTAEYCAVANELARRLGLADRVRYRQGSALAMPFADATFDVAMTQHVAMNIADKAGLYREVRRVLKVGRAVRHLRSAAGRGRSRCIFRRRGRAMARPAFWRRLRRCANICAARDSRSQAGSIPARSAGNGSRP